MEGIFSTPLEIKVRGNMIKEDKLYRRYRCKRMTKNGKVSTINRLWRRRRRGRLRKWRTKGKDYKDEDNEEED